MDIVTACCACAAGLFVVFMKDSLGPSISGQALGQSLLLTGALQYAVRMAAKTESFMTSVERIVEYSDLPIEVQNSDDQTESTNCPENWPKLGGAQLDRLPQIQPDGRGSARHQLQCQIR